MVLKDGKVLLALRKGSHGQNEYAFPGGHLEYMESFEDCARRETHEECSLEIENIRFRFVANVTKYAPKHFVHVGLVADYKSGEPTLREPERSGPWAWYPLDQLPQPMFEMCRLSFESDRTGNIFVDAPHES